MSLIEICPCYNAHDVLERAGRVAERRAKALRPPKTPVATPPPPVEAAPLITHAQPKPIIALRRASIEIPNFLKYKNSNGALPAGPAFMSVRRIIIVTAEYFDLTVERMLSHRRHDAIVWARHVGMYLARKLTPQSLPEIGRRFGGRDHTTVLHGIRRIEALFKAGDARVIAAIAEIERRLA